MKDFTLYQEAFELKQLGFNENCIATYDEDRDFDLQDFEQNYDTFPPQIISSPTYSQAFRWFREKYLLEGLVLPQDRRNPDPLPIYFTAVISYEGEKMTELFNSSNPSKPKDFLHYYKYEEAELACLRKLIEIVKENAN